MGLSHVQLFVTLWTVAHQALLSIGFFSKNTGVSCHFLLQGIFPIQELNLCLLSPELQADYLPTKATAKPNFPEEGMMWLLLMTEEQIF